MKVKRYFAASMRSALELVRQQQGPDVLILSNRKVEGGVELITADGETDPAQMEQFRPKRAPSLTAEDLRAPLSAPAATRSVTGASLWTNDDTIARMQQELTTIKSLLEEQLSGLAWHEFNGRNPLRARLLRVSARMGINARLGRELVAMIPERLEYQQAWRLLLKLIETRLPILDDPILRRGGRVALCGATGVGKTTLVSKFAARYALAHGAHQVALISTDDQRIGAHQQLKTFGRLLGITVRTARSVEELPGLLELCREKPLILIDTPGLPPEKPAFKQLVADFAAMKAGIDTHLVLSATTDYQSLAKVTRVVGELALSGCMLTKLDEAAVLGPSLSAIIESKLALGYLSAGQQIPDDLEVAGARRLIQQLVTLASQSPLPAESAVIEQAFAQ